MQVNNNLSCIPFYESLNEQDFRKWYSYGDIAPNPVPSNYWIPFYFIGLKQGNTVLNNIQIYRVCDCQDELVEDGQGESGIQSTYAQALISNGLALSIDGDKFLVKYPSNHTTSIGLPNGVYYLAVTIRFGTTTLKTFYSDAFQVRDVNNLVSIKWYDLARLDYEGGYIPYGVSSGNPTFVNTLYLDTEIGKPTYKFVEEGEERNGYFYPIKQLSEKSYQMSFIAPEYICDVMRLIRLSDVATITDRLGRIYNVEHFELEVEWLEQGHYANVTSTFETDTIVKKIGRAY